jgi:ribonuclease HepT-like protein
MKDEELSGLVRRIGQELDELQVILKRITEGWERSRRSEDDYYIDGVALNLHGFYSGFERIFAHIAETIDGELPQGDDWHKLLLGQMKTEVPGIRPPVISTEMWDILDDLRKFRHVVRNVYTHHLDPVLLGKLVKKSTENFAQLHAEITAFATFLEQ